MESAKKKSKKNFSVPAAKKLVEAVDDGDGEGDLTKQQEKKIKQTAEMKDKPKTKSTKSLTLNNQRSLSDAEYKEIFDAVLRQLPLSCGSQEMREDDSKAAFDEDGKDPSAHHLLPGDGEDGDTGKTCDDEHNQDKPHVDIDKALEPGQLDGKQDDAEEKTDGKVEEKSDDGGDEIEVASLASELSTDSSLEDMAMDVDQWDRPEDIQQANDHTPQSSKVDDSCRHTPPVKHEMKKQTGKANKLAPRKLCFDGISTRIKEDASFSGHSSNSLPKEKKKTSKDGRPVKKFLAAGKLPVVEEEVPAELGTWVQCSLQTCKKWRYLPDIHDPMDVAEQWNCSMHPDTRYNSCDKDEQEYDESDHIFTRYTLGSVVWAKMDGYPWWPAMIDIDPDYDTYCEILTEDSMYPTDFHVVFLDDRVTRAWIKIARIRPLQHLDLAEFSPYLRGHKFKRGVTAAMKKAREALDMPLQERLEKFGFAVRYKKLGIKQQLHKGHAGGNATQGTKASKKVAKRKLDRSQSSSEEDSDSDADSLHCTGYSADSDPSSSSEEDEDSRPTQCEKKHSKSHKKGGTESAKPKYQQLDSEKHRSKTKKRKVEESSGDSEVKSGEQTLESRPSTVGGQKIHLEKKIPNGSVDSSPKQEICQEDMKKKKKKKGFLAPSLPDTEGKTHTGGDSSLKKKEKKKMAEEVLNASASSPHPQQSEQKAVKPVSGKKERKAKTEEAAKLASEAGNENMGIVKTGNTHKKITLHDSTNDTQCSSETAQRPQKPKKRKQQHGEMSTMKDKAEVSKKMKKERTKQKDNAGKAMSPEKAEVTPSRDERDQEFFACLKLEKHKSDAEPRKKKMKLQKKETMQSSDKTESSEPVSTEAKVSKKKKRKIEAPSQANEEAKQERKLGKAPASTGAREKKLKSKSQKFVVPSVHQSDSNTAAGTTVPSTSNENKSSSALIKMQTPVERKIGDTEQEIDDKCTDSSPLNEADNLALKKSSVKSAKYSPLTLSEDRDQFVPEVDVPDDLLDVNDEQDASPMLSQTKEAVAAVGDVDGDVDSDCLDIDLEQDIPIPCLQQVLDVKGKGCSDDDGADSDPLEMAED